MDDFKTRKIWYIIIYIGLIYLYIYLLLFILRASWIREQTKVQDILPSVEKKWAWAGHVMRQTDNLDFRWTARVTEWQRRDGIRRQGRLRTRWRDEKRDFVWGGLE